MSKRRAPLDPEGVLAGRVKPTAVELLDLIHRVNPTGRDLAPREAELRYAQKSRLQSLLIRRFAAEIEVVPEPAQDGTVSLRVRADGRDACHAVLDALDEDARAWVRLQIDLGPPSSAAPAMPAARPSGRGLPAPDEEPEDSTSGALNARAQAALDAYDYDRARSLLESAFTASGGAAGPAAALLALLVDTLGDDAGALALQASLSRDALADGAVRGSLAVAAARVGDEERAATLARGADHPLAAAAFAALAAAALGRGAIDRAAAHLAQVKRIDPRHPSIEGLAGEIGRARARARAPEEEALAALVAAGRDDEAERKAGELLARWTESEEARRALRTIEERRRRREVERLAAEAEAARAAGDPATARARLAQALGAARGPEREGLERQLREIEAAERARREATQVERAERLLAAPDAREGLLAYLELDEGLRGRVQAGGAVEAIAWLALTGRGSARARVDAVTALATARERLDVDADAALQILVPHAALLDRVPEARRITREAEARIAERRVARAITALAAARAAFAAGGAAEAVRRLDEATVRDLPPGERAEAAALRAEATRIAERERRAAEMGRLSAAGQLFEARATAEGLAEGSEGEERARWEAEQRAIQARIQRAFRVEVDETPVPIGEGGTPAGVRATDEVLRWLTEDGRAVVMAEEHARWVRLCVLDVATLRARATVMLRAPEPLDNVAVEVRSDTVWLIGGRGAVLALDMESWDVRTFRPASDLLPAGERVESSAIVADADGHRFLWVVSEHDGARRARVLDLEQRRLVREVAGVQRVRLVPDVAGAACFRDGRLDMHEARGTRPLIGGRAPGGPMVALVCHPEGEDIIAFVRLPGPEGARLAWIEGDDHRFVDGADGDRPARIATAKEEGVTAILHGARGGGSEIVALGGAPLREIYRLPISDHTMLLQDYASRRVLAFQTRMDHVRAVPIGPTPPDMPLLPPKSAPRIRAAIGTRRCTKPTGERAQAAARAVRSMRGMPPATVQQMVRQEVRRHSDTPLALVDLGMGLLGTSDPTSITEGQLIIGLAIETYPDDPAVRLLRAEVQAHAGQWTEVRDRLDGLSADDLDDGRARHFDHLLALAALWSGDLDTARAAVDDGFGREGACSMEALAQLLTPPAALASPDAWSEEQPPLVQILGGVHAADGRLAEGDAEGALAVLDRELFWICREVQILARLAEASLRVPSTSRRERFRRLTALAKFVTAHAVTEPEQRLELPIPGAIWDRARLDDLAARARAWLDAAGT